MDIDNNLHVQLSTKQDNSYMESKESNYLNNPDMLETNYVHKTYDQIAEHFSSTRYKCWPKVEQFLQSLPPGSLVLDVGCGNGRFMTANPSLIIIGTDRSINLLKICHQKSLETFMDNCLQLDKTLRCDSFDAIISIAVIHHFANKDRRIKAIKTIFNLLTDNGLALIYVWAFEQKHSGKASKYLKLNTSISSNKHEQNNENEKLQIPIHQNRTEFNEKDLLVPWNTKQKTDKTYFRYYHLFSEGELENLIENACQNECKYQIKIESSYYDEGNWCVLIRKKRKQ